MHMFTVSVLANEPHPLENVSNALKGLTATVDCSNFKVAIMV